MPAVTQKERRMPKLSSIFSTRFGNLLLLSQLTIMKRIICLLLALALSASFLSCSHNDAGQEDTSQITGTPNDTTNKTPDETTVFYEPDDLPDNIDLGNEKITILTVDGKYWNNEIFSEELTSDPVSDSVFNREKFVEDRLNVSLEPEMCKPENYNETVSIQHASDDDNYQAFAARTVYFAPLVFDNILTDLYGLDYIDFSKPWWSELFTKESEIAGHLFLATGSLALSINKFKYVIFYNKKMADSYKVSHPEFDDIYSMVIDGNWTVEKLLELSEDIYQDVNGNSERDEEDIYGFGIVTDAPIDTIWSSFDLRILGKDEDGWFSIELNKDKVFNTLDKLIKLIHNSNGTFIQDGISMDPLEQKFASGSIMFMEGQLMSAETVSLRNMQDDYGLIPFPKYDISQKEYYSYAWDQYTSFSVPVTNRNPDSAAAVLEAMASYSYRETVPIYLDIALKGKYMSDAKSRRMMDLIVDGFRIDSAWIYSRSVGGFGPSFRTAVQENSSNYASEYTKSVMTLNIATKELKKRYADLWSED